MFNKKDAVKVISYKLPSNGFYLMLRLYMEITGKKSVNGMSKMLFDENTYQKSDKTLKKLEKEGIISRKDDELFITDGVKDIFDVILDSAYCTSFTNKFIKDNHKVLSFYWSHDKFAGVCVDDKWAHIVSCNEAGGVYAAYKKLIESKGLTDKFSLKKWNRFVKDKTAVSIQNPKNEAMMLHSMNRENRSRLTVMMLQDSRRLQIIHINDATGKDKMQVDTVLKENFYGAVIKELEYLKRTCRNKDTYDKTNQTGKIKPPSVRPKSDYEKIVSVKGFPKSTLGFILWYFMNFIKGIPKMIVNAVKKKMWGVLIYPVLAALLFFYNMYATCYLNDTFSLNRRAIWKNLTPYLMAGQLETPSPLYGFDAKWGTIDTVFLTAPMFAVLFMILRNIVLRIKKKKINVFLDIISLGSNIKKARMLSNTSKKTLWIVMAICFIAGFLIMNPITLFLISIMAFLIFMQGKENGAITTAMLFGCARKRRAVKLGKAPQPTFETYSMEAAYVGIGFLVYGIASVFVWIFFKYSFAMRFVVTLAMVMFCIIQIVANFSPRRKAAACVIVLSAIIQLQYCIIALADDGGWTESGRTLAGLMENAGFSAIIGITTALIVAAFATTLLPVIIAGGVAAAVPFIIGVTNTDAGDYIRESAHQYFFGPEDGDSQTALCTATQIAGFVASFLNPAVGASGNTVKVISGMKIAGDTISSTGDVASTWQDVTDLANGGDTTVSDVGWDILGLGFDIAGFKKDFSDYGDVSDKIQQLGRNYRYDKDTNILEKINKTIKDKNTKINSLNTNFDTEKTRRLAQESTRHTNKIADIENEIRDVMDGRKTDFPGGLDKDGYLNTLRKSEITEYNIHTSNKENIKNDILEKLAREKQQILNKYNDESKKILSTDGVDAASKGYDIKDKFPKWEDTFNGDTTSQPPEPQVPEQPQPSVPQSPEQLEDIIKEMDDMFNEYKSGLRDEFKRNKDSLNYPNKPIEK